MSATRKIVLIVIGFVVLVALIQIAILVFTTTGEAAITMVH